jgi:hypothetical protein
MKTHLKDIVNLMSRFRLKLLKGIHVMGIKDQRLLTYDVATQPQSVSYKRIVCVIRSTDRQPLKRLLLLFQLVAETVKDFMFRKERAIREIAIKYSHTVKLVVCGHQSVASILNGTQMPGCDISGYTYQSKVSHI